jgi:microcompartment protein CcmL/EutN
MNESLGLLEVHSLTAALAAVDAMEKAADVRVVQCELNDFYGVSAKIAGSPSAVAAAVEAGRRIAERMNGRPVAHVIPRVDPRAVSAIVSPAEYNPLIEQDVVFFPNQSATSELASNKMSQENSFALGLIETQGFTAVFEAIDTACKTANVEFVAKEKLGGGYITVVIRGELSAVTSAVEAGKAKIDALGKLIAAHVIARPSPAALALLPKIPA